MVDASGGHQYDLRPQVENYSPVAQSVERMTVNH